MANIFIISDTHFGHANILKFTRQDGTKLRNFSCVEEMDQHMIDCWNSVVRPQDNVYHLGDVAMDKNCINKIQQCNGHKRLILGNHDTLKTSLYLNFFEHLYSTRILDRIIFSHIPLHVESIGKCIANVHGHVHNNVDALHFGPLYYNVSCEVLNYIPISLEELKLKIKEQQNQTPIGVEYVSTAANL